MRLLFLLLSFFIIGHSQDSASIKVGVYQNPPKIYLDADHRPQGFFIDLLENIASLEGWNLSYVECEWDVCLDKLEAGEIDIMPDVAYSKEREARFAFNREIILSNWSIVYTRKSSKINTLLDLDQKRIATLKGSIQSSQLQETFELFEVHPTMILSQSFDEAFELVRSGKADAAIVNRHFGTMNHEHYNLDETSIFLNPAALKFAFHKKIDPLLIEAIDTHVNKLKNNPDSPYYTYMNKHLKLPEHFTIPIWFEWAIGIGITLIVLLIFTVLVFKAILKNRTEKIFESAEKLRLLEEEKVQNYQHALLAMISMIEQRDAYTAGHSERVAYYCELIAKAMGYSSNESDLLYQAATLHDIGKIAIPDAVLLKPDRLSTLEYMIIKEHVNVGVKILEDIPMFKPMANIIRYHHEHYDGSGYPEGLSGDQIPPLSRIMMVADAFDAMTTNRIYKHKKSIKDALDELISLKNVFYHPEVVDAAVTVLASIEITDNINQFPITLLEKERFVYFYKDTLTNLYNAKYLEAILVNTITHEQFDTLVIFSLHHFDHYNKNYGWEAGDTLLKDFSHLLSDLFSDSLIFRIHANDFIIMTNGRDQYEKVKASVDHFIYKNGLDAHSVIHSLQETPLYSYDELLNLLNH